MERYYVIATRWSEKDKKCVDYIAGEFNNYNNARIFKDAYNNYYSSHAIICDEYNLLELAFNGED